MINRASVMRND